MDVFDAVKQSVTAREAAEQYGIEVNRAGMAVCPFHNDKNPSMKLDRRFHCFGCGADGDAIGFVSRLFDLSAREAAVKLADDFHLSYDDHAERPIQRTRVKTEQQKTREQERTAVLALTDYLQILRRWEKLYAPRHESAEWNPRFVEAVQYIHPVERVLDLLMEENDEVKKTWLSDHRQDIEKLEKRRDTLMAEKKTNKERLKDITDSIEEGITKLFESDRFKHYLSVMSRFHRYSVNNTMLIYLQRPDATLVAGYNKWIDQFQRHVRKGEHGITIIAPTPFKKKIEAAKLDPRTKAPILDKDGNAVMEEKEVQIPMFRPIKVFDVSQTDGKPLPQLAATLNGSVEHFEEFMEALKRTAPVPLTMEPLDANIDGYYIPSEQRIALRAGMSEVQTVSAAIHEITHSMLHNPEKQEQEGKKSRNTQEVEAESVSYAVCQYYGIETADNSFGYIAGWSKNKTLPELKASLETINKTAGELITGIDRNFQAICRERGITQDTPERLATDLDAFAREVDHYEDQDRVEDPAQAISMLTWQLAEGKGEACRKWLRETVQEGSPGEAEQAERLLARLDAIAPEKINHYTVVPNEYSHNVLDRSLIQNSDDGTILGEGPEKLCRERVDQLNRGEKTPEAVQKELEGELKRWHCYIVPDLMTWNSQAATQPLVGRIDYLGSSGSVMESIQYTDPEKLRSDLERETHVGAPLEVVLYKDAENKTIPFEFLCHLDPPPRRFSTEPAPAAQIMERTDIELFGTYEEAAARFQALRQEAYNAEHTENPQTGQPYARLTFGVQREDPPGAADLIHVRNGENYLVDDFCRMEALHTSPEVRAILQRMEKDLGFDRVIRHEMENTGRYLPPEDIPFRQWENPFFGSRKQEDLLLADDTTYLHVKAGATGYDYSLYEASSGKLLDGGILEAPGKSMAEVQQDIFSARGMEVKKVEPVPLETLEQLQKSYSALNAMDSITEPETPMGQEREQPESIHQAIRRPVQWVSDDDRRESVLLQLQSQSHRPGRSPARKPARRQERGGER